MGLSITTVLGAVGPAAGGRLGTGGGTDSARTARRPENRRLVPSGTVGRCGVRRPSTQPDLDRAVVEIECGQIVALHQPNEVVNPLNVKRIARTGGVLRHSFTPHSQIPSRDPALTTETIVATTGSIPAEDGGADLWPL